MIHFIRGCFILLLISVTACQRQTGSDRRLFLTQLRDGLWKMDRENTISAVESFNGMHAFVFGEFNVNGSLHIDNDEDRGKQYIIFHKEAPEVIEFRYAVSFISEEQARENLTAEMREWSFEKVKDNARGNGKML